MLTIRLNLIYQHFREHGLKSTIIFIYIKIKSLIVKSYGKILQKHVSPRPLTVKQILHAHFSNCEPLQVYSIPKNGLTRMSIVMDTVSTGYFYGGVGTAIIFAALLAEAKQSRLRIITRVHPPQPENVAHILAAYNIQLTHEIEFVFSGPENKIDIFDDELFITTSWWTTMGVMASIRHDLILWLLQEDERMFYPASDQYLRCEQLLQNSSIRFAVNSKLLFDHLSHQFPQIAKNGLYFEPAFPQEIFYPRPKSDGDKFKLMFYARPNNQRNLFYFGIELIEAAIMRGIIDLAQWDIVLVGKGIPPLVFAENYTPKKYENLQWKEYAKLIGNIDLGLCLMYTPHPSYPPLDLAASGAVVITNHYGNKQELEFYSKNILCGDLTKESMLQTLSQGISLALNTIVREENYRNNTLQTDWRHTFTDIIQKYKSIFK